MKRALITGITGQDGSYLAELLLGKGYEVHGVIRRSSSFNTGRIDHIYQDPHEAGRRLILHYGDLNDASSLNRTLRLVDPQEIYNLGAQSHVKVSFDTPEYTGEVTGLGSVRLLEAIRELEHPAADLPGVLVGDVRRRRATCRRPRRRRSSRAAPTPRPRSYAYWMTVNYREAYGLFAVNGILFNHESPRRGETFVSRKITRAVGRIRHGLQDRLYLGNLEARRDWGYAKDYVEAMWRMLQQDAAAATTSSRRERATPSASSASARSDAAGWQLDWRGPRAARRRASTRRRAACSSRSTRRYLRPTEVEHLLRRRVAGARGARLDADGRLRRRSST